MPLENETVFDLGIQIADALDAEHLKGIRPWKNPSLCLAQRGYFATLSP